MTMMMMMMVVAMGVCSRPAVHSPAVAPAAVAVAAAVAAVAAAEDAALLSRATRIFSLSSAICVAFFSLRACFFAAPERFFFSDFGVAPSPPQPPPAPRREAPETSASRARRLFKRAATLRKRWSDGQYARCDLRKHTWSVECLGAF